MAKTVIYRQGDVLLQKVSELPEGAVPSTRKMANKNVLTLAFGEATGHHHSIKKSDSVALLEVEENGAKEIFLNIMGTDATLTHQEHKSITLPPASYRVTIQREYSPEAIQNVMD